MKQKPVAVILAGGKATRMGEVDKPLQLLAGKELLQYVIETVEPAVAQLIVSVNHKLDSYRKFELPLVTDAPVDQTSPLVGIYSAMIWYRQHVPAAQWLACAPADVPFFPGNYVELLLQAVTDNKADIAYVETPGQVQPLFSLWRLSLADAIGAAIAQGRVGVYPFISSRQASVVEIASGRPVDFVNVNTLDELNALQATLAAN